MATALTLSASVAGAEVSYHKFGRKIYGSDGSETYEFGGRTYTRLKNGKEIVCHEFSGKVYCRR